MISSVSNGSTVNDFDPWPDFKVAIFFDIEYLRNDKR